MKLTSLPSMYYKMELLTDQTIQNLKSTILAYWNECKSYLPNKLIEYYDNDCFHDWYLQSMWLNGEKDGLALTIHLSRLGKMFEVCFHNVTFASVKGDIATANGFYIAPGQITPIGQILDILFAYDNCIEVLILLDNERYIELKCSTIEVE